MTAPMRCRTRRAVSGLSCQRGAKDLKEVGGGDVGNERVADEREGIRLKARRPVLGVLRIAPRATLLFQDLGGGLLEGGRAPAAALLGQRVAARAGQPAVGERLLAGFGEGHPGVAAETEHAHLAANDELLHPSGARPTGRRAGRARSRPRSARPRRPCGRRRPRAPCRGAVRGAWGRAVSWAVAASLSPFIPVSLDCTSHYPLIFGM